MLFVTRFLSFLIKNGMSRPTVSRTIPALSSIYYFGSLANIDLNLFTLASKRVRSVARADSDGNLSAVWINRVASLPVRIGVFRIGRAIAYDFYRLHECRVLSFATFRTQS